MGLISMGSGTTQIGLDIGTDRVRAAILKPSGSGITVTGYARVPMSIGSVVDGEIVDPEAVSAAIKDLWRQPGIRGKDVSIGVSNQKVVVRLIDLPFMERAELEGAIQYQAQDYIPIPVEDAILDFQIIGDYMTPADEHMMEVLLVAAQRDMITSAVSAVEAAGLRLNRIDVTTFAITRALLGGATVLPDADEEPGEAVAVIHIGSGLTNIAVVERGVPRFTRVSSLCGNQFTQAVANVLNLTFDEAEQLKIDAGLPDISGEVPAAAVAADDADAQMLQVTQDALEREVNKFIAEVRRSLDYYLTQTTQVRTIRRIIMTGSGAQLRNMPTYLEKGLQAEVTLSDPLRFVQVSGSVQAAVTADRMGAAPAIGLALGGLI